MRPRILDNVGLIPALRWLADRMNLESGINSKVVARGSARKLRPETETIIFRIVQAALSNVRRHSKATEAVISINFETESIKITIKDNGVGFNLKETLGNLATEGKLGIIGMEQRVKFLNGTFDIQSQPGKGTLISIDTIIT